MSRFAVLFLILIGLCYSDSQDTAFYFPYKKSFSQCYNKTLQWANKYKDKYDSTAVGLARGSTVITPISDSGIIRIFSLVQCGNYLDSYKSEGYNLILTSRTDSLKIELQLEPGRDYSSCIDKIKDNLVSVKQEIAQLILNIPDSNMAIQTATHDTLTSHQYSWNQIHPPNNNVFTSPSEKSTITNTPSAGRNFFGAVTLLAGIVAGMITVFDGTTSDYYSVTTGTGSKEKTTTVDVPRWQGRSGVMYTIELTLSIAAITSGIALLCR